VLEMSEESKERFDFRFDLETNKKAKIVVYSKR
jgi:hypothetical protein